MSDLARVVNNLGQLAATYERSPAVMVAAKARIYRDVTQASIFAAAPGGRLRHVGKKGSRVGVISRSVPVGGGGAGAIIQATGQLQIIEKDTKPHTIPRTRTVKRQRTPSGRLSKTRLDGGRDISGRKHLYINGTWVIGPVKHPGTKGKHPFEKGIDRAHVPAGIAAHEVLIAPATRIFR